MSFEIVEQQLTVKSLPGSSYTDPDIFQLERRYLFRSIPFVATPSVIFKKKEIIP